MSAAAGGHIRKRGNNSFELRWRVAGKIKTETIRGTLADAKRALRKRLTEADQGISPGRGTVGEWLTRWLAIVEPEISRCTYVTWLSHVKCYLRPEFGDIAFAKLTADRLQQGWSRLALRIQPSTLKVVRLTMSNCLSRAVELRVLSYNPAAGLRRRATRTAAPPEMAILSPDQIAPLIDAARPTHLFAPVLLGLIGLRRGETAALRWRNVDLDRGTVTVSESMREPDAAHRSIGATKSGAGRRVALPAFIAAELKAWRNRQREEFLRLGARVGRDTFVCTRPDSRGMNPNAVTIQFKKLARRLDLPMHYHSLRHTAASLALAGGAPVKAVQEMLGHASAVLTMQVYAHSLGDAPDRAAAALDRMVAIPVARQV